MFMVCVWGETHLKEVGHILPLSLGFSFPRFLLHIHGFSVLLKINVKEHAKKIKYLFLPSFFFLI